MANDVVRVAKWIDGANDSLNLFKDFYLADSTSGVTGNAVKSTDGAKVIASGISGSYDCAPMLSANESDK